MLEYGYARPQEEGELLDFINYVFSLDGLPTDFLELHPRVFSRPGFSKHTVVAREDGRIIGAVSFVTGQLLLGSQQLSYGFIGNVSTHPYCRGQGHMKALMPMALDALKVQGCDVVLLGGQRQRYQHFGFEDIGFKLSLGFTKNSLRHSLGKINTDGYRFMPLDKENQVGLDAAYALHQGASLRCLRSREDFPLLLRTWKAQQFLAYREQQLLGYFCLQDNLITEINLHQGADLPYMLAAYLMQQGMPRLVLRMQPGLLASQPALFAAAESWQMKPLFMARVFNWQHFLAALLGYKAENLALANGEIKFEVQGSGCFYIAVSQGRVQVLASAGPGDLSLDAQAALSYLTHPLTVEMHPVQLLKNWLPLPFDFPEQDAF